VIALVVTKPPSCKQKKRPATRSTGRKVRFAAMKQYKYTSDRRGAQSGAAVRPIADTWVSTGGYPGVHAIIGGPTPISTVVYTYLTITVERRKRESRDRERRYTCLFLSNSRELQNLRPGIHHAVNVALQVDMRWTQLW